MSSHVYWDTLYLFIIYKIIDFKVSEYVLPKFEVKIEPPAVVLQGVYILNHISLGGGGLLHRQLVH